jgi:hypothetical protein
VGDIGILGRICGGKSCILLVGGAHDDEKIFRMDPVTKFVTLGDGCANRVE